MELDTENELSGVRGLNGVNLGYSWEIQDKTETPTKEEYAVAKYLKFSLPDRDGKLHGMEVKCFMGNAAVDKLMDSKWSGSKSKDPLFINRASCVAYMLRLLEKGLFHRAEREKRKKDKDKERPKKKKTDKESEKDESATAAAEELRERKGKKVKKVRKEKEGDVINTEETEKKESAEKKEEKKEEKKKKRLKLVMPEKQFFEDGDEVYVWIYDPVNAKTFLIGLLMVLGAIGLCMFPLWPSEVRLGVYYLSLCAAGFVGFILVLVVVRLILFCCVWVLTFGKHYFWFLPNLTEDVGFFDSFKPLYKHERATVEEPKPKEEKKKKKKKEVEEEKNGDSNEDVIKTGKSSDKDDSDEFEVIKKEDIDNGDKKSKVEEDDEVREDEEDGEDNIEENDTEDEDEQEDKKTK